MAKTYYGKLQDPNKPLLMTNSMARVLGDCEKKFVREYIEKREYDSDYENPKYWAFGSTMHEMLDEIKHDPKKFLTKRLVEIAVENELEQKDIPKLLACFRSYFALHLESGMKVKATEVRFQNDLTMGSVDIILEDSQGKWWISDLKTVGVKLDPTMAVKLKNDQQMNLYAAFHDILASQLGLDPDKFGGVKYREVEKPRERFRKSETLEAFALRLANLPNPPAREISLPFEEMNWEGVYENFLQSVGNGRLLKKKYLEEGYEGQANFNNCVKFNTPCPFYSGCYGVTFSGAKQDTKSEKQDELLNF